MNDQNGTTEKSAYAYLRVTVAGLIERAVAPAAALVVLMLIFFLFIEMRIISVDINSSRRGVIFHDDGLAQENALRFGAATMVNIELTYLKYHGLSERIAEKLDRRESFVIRPTYREIRRALEDGDLDIAMVCTGIYTHAHSGGGARLLVSPEYEGDLEYRGLLLVSSDSPANSLDDLRGKEAVFTDAESFTGHILPVAELIRRGYNPDEFFSKIRFVGCHDLGIKAVDRKTADVAAVSSIKWNLMLRDDPSLAERMRVVWQSEAFGPPPVLVSAKIDDELFDALREAFLHLHEDEDARESLRNLAIKRFVEANEDEYRSALAIHRSAKAAAGEQSP